MQPEKQYVGIDLHRRRSVIVRMDEAGEVLKISKINNSPANLAAVLAEAGPNPEVVLEACYGWYWAADLIRDEGANIHMVHPLGLHWDSRRVKNDVRDATELAHRLRRNDLPESWIAPPEVRELRELVRYRGRLVHYRSSAKAQVHGVMAKYCFLPTHADQFVGAGAEALAAMAFDGVYKDRIESLMRFIAFVDKEIDGVEVELHRRLRPNRGYRAIQEIKGVGPRIAAIFIAEIGDVTRFPSARHLCSWAGLTPKLKESDKTSNRGRITKQGSTIVRWAAVEAVARHHGEDVIAPTFDRIAERRNRQIARVAAARKLLTLVYYGLRDGEIRSLYKEAA